MPHRTYTKDFFDSVKFVKQPSLFYDEAKEVSESLQSSLLNAGTADRCFRPQILVMRHLKFFSHNNKLPEYD